MAIKYQLIGNTPIVFDDGLVIQNNKEAKDITEKEYDKLLEEYIKSLPDLQGKEVYETNIRASKSIILYRIKYQAELEKLKQTK